MPDLEHEARRFRQVAHLERELNLKNSEVVNARAHVKELKPEAEGILMQLRAAARDEGDLPLLDMMEEVGAGGTKSH